MHLQPFSRIEDGMSMMKTAIATRHSPLPPEQPAASEAAAPAAETAAQDAAFCAAILPRVSRTFALSIEALPDTLRPAVRTAYLLCRLVDSIEDEPVLPLERRGELFDVFDRLLEAGGDASALESACMRAGVGGSEADGELCRRAGAVFRELWRLPASQREAILPHVREMSTGMRAYCARGRGHRLTDLADLEHYCYFVAGTVGNLLTALFEQTVALPESSRVAVRELAVSFGIGLQMVNVVKDVAADFSERGACFLPSSLAREHGLVLERLLDPAMRDAGVAVVRAVCARAREHLRRAEEYVSLWPSVGPDAQAGRAVRLFCVVPLALALATLRTVEESDDTLRAGTEPKVSRATVAGVLAEAGRAATSNSALAALLQRYGANAGA